MKKQNSGYQDFVNKAFRPFDFNRNGKADIMEQAAAYSMMNNTMQKNRDLDEDEFQDYDDDDDNDDEFDEIPELNEPDISAELELIDEIGAIILAAQLEEIEDE